MLLLLHNVWITTPLPSHRSVGGAVVAPVKHIFYSQTQIEPQTVILQSVVQMILPCNQR